MDVSAAGKKEAPDLDDYRSLVAGVFDDASRNSNVVREFENFGAGHARIVLEVMVQHAASSVCIYSHCFAREIYSARWFDSFLARVPQGQITLLVESKSVFDDERSILSTAKHLAHDSRVSIRYVPETGRAQHVALIDGKFARVERSKPETVERSTNPDFKASVALGTSSQLVSEALRLFNLVLARSIPLSVR